MSVRLSFFPCAVYSYGFVFNVHVVSINSHKVARVCKFLYLESILHEDRDSDVDIKRSI